MSGRNRTACRARKKRCDETWPQCERCVRLQNECIWPPIDQRMAAKRMSQQKDTIINGSSTASSFSEDTQPDNFGLLLSATDLTNHDFLNTQLNAQSHQLSPSTSLSVTPAAADLLHNEFAPTSLSSQSDDPLNMTPWNTLGPGSSLSLGAPPNALADLEKQEVEVTYDYIRMLMHWSGAPLSRKLVQEYQIRMVPSLKGSKMLRASAKLFHRRYIQMHEAEHHSRMSAARRNAPGAEAEQHLNQELLQLEARENLFDISHELSEPSLVFFVDQMLSQALRQASPTLQFKEILGTLLNVSGYHQLYSGNEEYYVAFDRARDFIEHSQTRPAALDLYALSGLDFRPANAWVIADVGSAVCRGTSLHCRYIASNSSSEPYEDYHGLEWISRCDDQLFAALADTAALARQLRWQPPKTESEHSQAQAIARVIESMGKKEARGPDSLFTLTLNELWREGIRIYFHQAIYQRGQLYPDIRQAHDTMLGLIAYADSMERSIPPAVALALFLGASVSIDAGQRAQWIKALQALGHHKGFVDNLAIIEKVWQVTDATGRTVDWLELTRQGVVEPPAFP